tara:strand:+ start:2335 stop:3468 length:1134 start_codon:yes stop_codon:yes gene_type:complete
MRIETTVYYDEMVRYAAMAKTQQIECNLGTIPHLEGSVKDDLMRHVELYDVVNRKYAGFTQIVLDLFYNTSANHPYAHKLHDVRKPICKSFEGVESSWGLAEWLYVFIVHRVTGSGINYAKKPSGYNNTILPKFCSCDTIEQMTQVIANRESTIYTSVGYQFPAFPKPIDGYKLGGDYFLCSYAPRLARDLAEVLNAKGKRDLRDIGEWMFEWNKQQGLRAYKFQYAALVSDIADFFPQFVNLDSPFFYGSNAVECLKYAARPLSKGKEQDFLDEVTMKFCKDIGSTAYNGEDIFCDGIRWIENYVRPGYDYNHLDRDKIWNSSTIVDHPYGRQKAMLEHGLIDSFNSLTVHPSDDHVLKLAGMSKGQYLLKVYGLD